MPVITETKWDKDPIKINNVPFTPVPGVNYRSNYVKIAIDLENNKNNPAFCKELLRQIVLTDIWFINYFIRGILNFNDDKGFFVKMCDEVTFGPQSHTLDIWGRFHGKSSIITIAETAQYHLKNPDECTCIFSFKKPAATQKFLFSIMKIYENDLMKYLFDDVLYQNPGSQGADGSPSWSLENGIIIKRTNQTRSEKTVQGSGLVEGMETGGHFERRVYDDVETDDMRRNIDQLIKCYEKFDMSANLATGQDSDIVRVIGTFYSHLGPLVKIRDLKDVDGNKVYHTRIVPSEDENGNPVLVSRKKLNEYKTMKNYNSQHKCNPSPEGVTRLDYEFVTEVSPEQIPDNLYKVLLVDWAGDNPNEADDQKDAWAIGVFGINPESDDWGTHEIYICDLFVSPTSSTNAVEEIVRMYLNNGQIQKLGIERINSNFLAINVRDALDKRGRAVTYKNKRLIDLLPGGRNKIDRIGDNLSWYFDNSKIFINKNINPVYRQRFKREVTSFPTWKFDSLDVLSYSVDLIKDEIIKYKLKNMGSDRKIIKLNFKLSNKQKDRGLTAMAF
jgi:hypothetical protein